MVVKDSLPPAANKKNIYKSFKYFNDENKISLYLKEIAQNKSLSLSEEAELAKRIRQNDLNALNKLILANLKFVVSVSRNYQHQGLSLSDLINEGNLGLIKAAHHYDETKNFKFISYAVWWIRQAILLALSEQTRIIKVPMNKVGDIQKINKIVVRLEQKIGRKPTLEEISEETDISIAEVQACLEINKSHFSLDTTIVEEDDFKIEHFLKDDRQESVEEKIENTDKNNEIKKALSSLEPREEHILKLYYGIENGSELTLDEIGHRLSLTRERVRQIKEKALRRLKHISRSEKLMVYKN